MKRILLFASIAMLTGGTASADGGSVRLHCSGSYDGGEPSSKNIMVALDGGWIDVDGRMERSSGKTSQLGEWRFEERREIGSGPYTMTVDFDPDRLNIIVRYNHGNNRFRIMLGACTPFKNPFAK